MIDILYVSYNRLSFTKASFTALVENTDWRLVRKLFVADDMSDDGTAEWLSGNRIKHGRHGNARSFGKFGGPVAAMNWYLDATGPGFDQDAPEIFAKIDNDFVVCPGWLPEMLRQMELHPKVDILGTEPGPWGDCGLPPAMPDVECGRDITVCEHIGGKGLIRRRAFDRSRPEPGGWNGYQGFTQWQHRHPEVVKAWICPDLPCFGLDQIRREDGPWRAMAEQYADAGWQRLWAEYGDDKHYRWWLDL